MTAPDPAFVVQQQVFPPGPAPADTIVLYDGATVAKNGFASWKAWDIRSWINRLTWDLLRFQLIDSGKPNSDRTVPYGLRDTVTAIWWLADQNHQLLQQLVAKSTATSVNPPTVKSAAEAAAHQEVFVDAVRQHLHGQEAIYRANGVVNPGLLQQAGLVVKL
jgi:hypothetical protein